jgi:hypothetical protein
MGFIDRLFMISLKEPIGDLLSWQPKTVRAEMPSALRLQDRIFHE